MTLQDKLNLNGERKLAEGKAIGRKEGIAQLIQTLYKNGVELAKISKKTDISASKIEKILENKESKKQCKVICTVFVSGSSRSNIFKTSDFKMIIFYPLF